MKHSDAAAAEWQLLCWRGVTIWTSVVVNMMPVMMLVRGRRIKEDLCVAVAHLQRVQQQQQQQQQSGAIDTNQPSSSNGRRRLKGISSSQSIFFFVAVVVME